MIAPCRRPAARLALWANAVAAWLGCGDARRAPALAGRDALHAAADRVRFWFRDALGGRVPARSLEALHDALAWEWIRAVADPAHALTEHHAFACAALGAVAEALERPLEHGARVPAARRALEALNAELVAFEGELARAMNHTRALQQGTYYGDQVGQRFARVIDAALAGWP